MDMKFLEKWYRFERWYKRCWSWLDPDWENDDCPTLSRKMILNLVLFVVSAGYIIYILVVYAK